MKPCFEHSTYHADCAACDLSNRFKNPNRVAGGKKAAKTNKKRYGDSFFSEIAAIGGKKSRTGGFYANRELAREAGRKGGLKSRRTKNVS